MKKFKPIIIIPGEPNSIFLEIFFKSFKKKIKNPVILIGSLKVIRSQMKKLNYKIKIRILNYNKLNDYILNNNTINIINIDYDFKKPFEPISKRSNKYIRKSLEIGLKLIKNKFSDKLINGPISKKNFLNKKYLGMTEYFSKEFSINKSAMLIYNEKLSVCPITTHLPLKHVSKKISKEKIIEKVKLINEFYTSKLKFKPKIAILGLNPHCETIDTFDEDKKIITPAIVFLKKKNYFVSGPFSADTIFLSQNRKRFNVIVGMYHDQVLSPLKTLFEYDAINITLGLPFLRISPDHGPNEDMLGKNKSNPLSLMRAISFLDQN